jgi:predicted AAA+ superfamily ATPase
LDPFHLLPRATEFGESKMPSEKDLNRFRGEIGESIVAYELMKRRWNVMKHLGGQGYDLCAIKGTVERHIEVQTTDPKLKTGKARRQLTVLLSESEKKEAGFLVFYIHGYSTFFIIPQKNFPSSGSITVFLSKDEKQITAGDTYEPFRNKWELLE